jgi:hypothetical protein
MRVDDLSANDLIGAVKRHGQWRLYGGTLAEWILDYAAYDPAYDPITSAVYFWSGLLTVDETNTAQYIDAMTPYEL